MYRTAVLVFLSTISWVACAAIPASVPMLPNSNFSGVALAQRGQEQRATNLNSSKSNVNRMQQPAGAASKATTVKGSKSNSSE